MKLALDIYVNNLILKSITRLSIVLLGTINVPTSLASDERNLCLEKIKKQGQVLLVINSKIMAMPPLSSVYVSTNDIWKKAISEKDLGNFKECNRLLDIGIKYSEPYAR
jgi:hypothetical protein